MGKCRRGSCFQTHTQEKDKSQEVQCDFLTFYAFSQGNGSTEKMNSLYI